ncbi:monosaccharide ABC transporter ATP-binding protein (CUT2 family) [Bacillus oleivorans]|uniref:Monosaccharide ABC transporter ATP-binding protein (CUT2 family) n=1 Tax=Bacillus oleivorans TaxID=1448271 RepID=A0A285CTJ9_9BACI|nr:sugar ABC transporter ATP-binding protein [Bacillus oleivorans]SNX70844.1 monosaccharide ABC transporter ATP-binding protein (CUT2 family) [Bacillus oleivorans]
MRETSLVMRNIEKKFGSATALKNASFQLKSGEVHALLGANGAGKSTLMNILSGVYEQDRGEILLNGESMRFKSPKAAKIQGIYCVYQEVDTAIVPQMSAAENILLDTFASSKDVFISKRKLYEKARQILKQVHADHIELHWPASELSLAEKQIVLIARALVHSAKVIIFDEPTAPLSIHEAEQLFKVIKSLKNKGVGIIFITHRLPEVFEICDQITIMREGTVVRTLDTTITTPEQVVELMLGRSLSTNHGEREKRIGRSVLEIKELSAERKLHDISFSVCAGEIVGVVGLVGAGKTELAKSLMGVTPVLKGTINVTDQAVKVKHPSDAIEAGMVLIPEERRKEGLFIHESVRKNATFPNLKKFTKGLFINHKSERTFTEHIISFLQIKAGSTETPIHHLSGGNQQKVAIGKWMSQESSVYLFDEPTKGVDIGAKNDIYNLIRDLSEEGKGILYLSSEIHEILTISDRILVMYDGRVVKEFAQGEATQERILLYASGGKEDQHEREKHPISI